ncbi:MAG: PEP-CTERM sorting domain-containing protein [Armatimonadetes bacterium]|nr:PEP-CTERM sorting domain-containing protein [Armatimonadota bacterium]
MSKGTVLISLAAVFGATAANAHLTDCQYHAIILDNPVQNSDAGKINQIKASNKVDGTDLAFYANFDQASNNKKANGFWLVLSPGPNPKGKAGELAIFYFDASNTSSPVLTSYVYNGVNGDNSFNNGNGVGGPADKIVSSKNLTNWIKDLTVKDEANGTRTLGFRIDPTVVNGYNPMYNQGVPYTGAKFDQKIGIWFHPVNGLETKYGVDGFLTKFAYAKQGWYDSPDGGLTTQCSTDPVPEPASMAALGLGVASILRRKSRKA